MRVLLKRAGWIAGLVAVGALLLLLLRTGPERGAAEPGEVREEVRAVQGTAALSASAPRREPVPGTRRQAEEALALRARDQAWRASGASFELTPGVPIEGVLFVPLEWELADFEFEVRLLEALDHHGGGSFVSVADYELEPTGEPDDEVREKLVAAHKS